MGIWILMFLISLFIPGLMVGAGLWMEKKPPQSINYICGYRTRMSMKNMDTWMFAHKTCGEIWQRWGKWMFLTAAPMFFLIGKSGTVVGTAGTILMLLQIIPLLGSIIPVEKSLRETFDENGNRK